MSAPSVYVSVDMEGCADVVHWDEVRPSARPEYERARRIMTYEVNAVIAGAFEGGAGRVVINDSHSTMRNLIAGEVDARAVIVTGRLKPQFMLEGIGGGFDIAFFVGYHGAIGDAMAVMGHTYSPRIIFECRLNGVAVGEVTINAALAGHYGVPVALVSGDATTLEEAKRVAPRSIGVETKRSVSYYAAECLSPHAVRGELQRAAAQAAARAGAFPALLLETPMLMEFDTLTTAHADVLSWIPGAERTHARTVRFTPPDAPAMYRALMAVIYLGAAASR